MDYSQIESMFAEFDNIQDFHQKKFADILARYSKPLITLQERPTISENI